MLSCDNFKAYCVDRDAMANALAHAEEDGRKSILERFEAFISEYAAAFDDDAFKILDKFIGIQRLMVDKEISFVAQMYREIELNEDACHEDE